MKRLRNAVPILAIVALIALLLKMPEVPTLFGIFKCETCIESRPYLPLIGSGYFALLFALSMLFPTFPNPLIARGGLIWAILLSLALTFMDWPSVCVACIIGHLCNIAIWMIWWRIPQATDTLRTTPGRLLIKERLFLTLLAPICVVALFGCLNLTFMVYNLKSKHTVLTTSLKSGDRVPSFNIQDADIAATGNTLINFVSPDCSYCKEQLAVLSNALVQLANDSYRLINISPSLTPELIQQSSTSEWMEDKDGSLRTLFKVTGYPTLFVVGTDGTIRQIVSGVSDDLKKVADSVVVHTQTRKRQGAQ